MNKLFVLLVVALPLLASGQQGNPQIAAGVTTYVVKKLVIQENQNDIYVMGSEYKKPKRLAEGAEPELSPDGEKVVYCVRGMSIGEFGQIQLINTDGSGHKQLTKLKNGACLPTWSPDGDKIAFTVYGGKTPMIYVMGKDGENVTEIIAGYGPRWSPGGKQLLFCRFPEGHSASSIWIANADGTGATKVTEDNSVLLEAAWFPDGKGIVFSSDREYKHTAHTALFGINLDGSGLKTIATDKHLSLSFPVFSPDGKQVVMDAYSAGSYVSKVLLMDLVSYHASVLAYGFHPSVQWEKR